MLSKEGEKLQTKLLRQSQVVQSVKHSSYITPTIHSWFVLTLLVLMRHILALYMFDMCIFIHSPRIAYINNRLSRQLSNFTIVFYVDFCSF